MSIHDAMKRYCAGDAAAFGEVYGALAPKIRAHVRRLVPESDAAEDVLQLTFLKLHGARATYAAGSDPLPWVHAIARRSCLDELRRRRRARVHLQRGHEPLPETPAGVTGAPLGDEPTEAADDVRGAALLAALEQLPRTQRDAVVLTKLEGLPVRRAAELLGTTETAVKLRAHRAYARLRELLERSALRDDVLDRLSSAWG